MHHVQVCSNPRHDDVLISLLQPVTSFNVPVLTLLPIYCLFPLLLSAYRCWMLDAIEVTESYCSFHLPSNNYSSRMIFRRPKSYSITLQRAHSLLKIPREASNAIRDELTQSSSSRVSALSRDQIQHAFRSAAKLHHPDLALGKTAKISETAAAATAPLTKEANTTIRECYEARELLLDYYVRKSYIQPEIEVFLRLSFCLGLAIGTYYHDLYLPERRKQQIQRRDAEFNNFGPRW
eukprot:scaffold240_cov106-Skeletonema_dohrnii-CCMP3373.AAC.8